MMGSHKIVQQRHMALRVGCVEIGGVAGAKYACTSTSGLKFFKKVYVSMFYNRRLLKG